MAPLSLARPGSGSWDCTATGTLGASRVPDELPLALGSWGEAPDSLPCHSEL